MVCCQVDVPPGTWTSTVLKIAVASVSPSVPLLFVVLPVLLLLVDFLIRAATTSGDEVALLILE